MPDMNKMLGASAARAGAHTSTGHKAVESVAMRAPRRGEAAAAPRSEEGATANV
eukprot:CAMPEP_0204038454 /NCGR_PEP_ID=MMETSP0360-20130528/87421_1 /ASSEMBLY_ACC=CAM_ASM_000342 /TAXON_ID=268821 /ORGANISM="Scrippsiella Hangoei, Strain SHTV-5" /LENGTH=53 /DNA_ID=CAMNT_0050984143 /DNA_START=55 /DNA_END=213 /DNA_ORIENTATION=+